jgi:hypothetical protein
MGGQLPVSEIQNFASAIHEYWFGGVNLAATLSVLVLAVSKLEPYAAAGSKTANFGILLLQNMMSWIKRHRYALIGNSVLLGVIYAAFGAYTDVDRQLKNPITITFETDNNDPFLKTDVKGILWVRARANNSA